MFAQTAVILLDGAWDAARLARALDARPAEFAAATSPTSDPASGMTEWMQGSVRLRLAPESCPGATVEVDVFERPWPDGMGDPKTDPGLFAAWAMRQFGMGTFPYALQRARVLPRGRDAWPHAAKHRAFLRLRLHYLGGIGPDDPIFPADRDLGRELIAMARVACRLLREQGALAWFVPGADLLLTPSAALPCLEAQASGAFTRDAWMSVRAIVSPQRVVLETVGLDAIGRLDHQIVVDDPSIPFDDAEAFLLSLAFEAESSTTETMREGPGGAWYARTVNSEEAPPRELVCWSRDPSADAPSVAEVSEGRAEDLAAHLERFLGPSDFVWHELISDRVHVDVLVHRAKGDRKHHVLVTQGMSALPMTTPPGAESFRFAELLLALPGDWPLDDRSFEDEQHYWPIRQLKSLARLPHDYATWLGWGHTIPNGADAAPYHPSTHLGCAIVGAPVTTLPDEAVRFESEGQTVTLYAVHFLHRDEMEAKLRHGADHVFERLAKKGVTEVLDVRRRSVFAKWFGLF